MAISQSAGFNKALLEVRTLSNVQIEYLLQGIALPELGDEGGHITEPPLAEPS
jgi:hypothetical protein